MSSRPALSGDSREKNHRLREQQCPRSECETVGEALKQPKEARVWARAEGSRTLADARRDVEEALALAKKTRGVARAGYLLSRAQGRSRAEEGRHEIEAEYAKLQEEVRREVIEMVCKLEEKIAALRSRLERSVKR
jgi:hypothetical protein